MNQAHETGPLFEGVFALPALALDLSLLALESASVVTLRLYGLAGLWPMSEGERDRMLSEKPQAFVRAATAAAEAASQGGRSDEIVTAALRPLRTKTRANMRRLSRKARA